MVFMAVVADLPVASCKLVAARAGGARTQRAAAEQIVT
jgi:hypothetical protein